MHVINSGIYKIYFTNDLKERAYYGSTVDFDDRWAVHLRDLNNNNHHSILLQRAFNKYGEANLVIERVELVEDVTKLLEREQVYLDYIFGIGKQFNICRTAGSMLGYRHTEEARAKISAGQLGVKRSAETKARISAANAGKKHSEESKLKISAAASNKSEEHRAKISDAQSGSNNHKAKLTEQNIHIIRLCFRFGMSTNEIAKKFNVDQSNISQIKTGNIWATLNCMI